MTADEAVAALDRLAGPDAHEDDCEVAHIDADDILLAAVPPEVSAAYQRVVDRCNWWAHA